MGTEITMEDAVGSMPSQQQEPQQQAMPQGVVLVVLDVNKDICTQALNWALGHVVRKGDALRLVGVLSHVLNPSKSFPGLVGAFRRRFAGLRDRRKNGVQYWLGHHTRLL